MDVMMLGAAELRDLLSPAVCLAALEEAYRNLHASPGDGGQSVEFRTEKGKFHVKAGLLPGTHRYFAAKVNANFPENPDHFGLPTIQGLIVLCTCDTGRPVAVLDSGELTGRRTAAATALAAKFGARGNASNLAMIGCGAQARYQVEAILDIRPIMTLSAFDRDEAKARALASWAGETFGLQAGVSPSLGAAVLGCDLCVTGTTSTRAIVDAAMVPPGSFIAAVGADNPDKQELDPRIFADARIIVDDLAQCVRYGDLAHALRDGVVTVDAVHATLADLAAGARPGRLHDEEIVVFDSTGSGLQDVAAAAAAFEARGRSATARD